MTTPAPAPRTLDYAPRFDPRSAAYRAGDIIDATTPRSRVWGCSVRLDQGREGACVGFGWSGELAAKPVVVPGITNDSARALQLAALRLDGVPGEDMTTGTSVLAGAQAVAAEGHLDEYRWAFTIDELALAVGHLGPVVLGVNWHESSYEPAMKAGWPILTLDGPVVGGHCILARGYSTKTGRFLLHNSWGRSWGRNGVAYIEHDDLATLLADQGEACVPVRRR